MNWLASKAIENVPRKARLWISAIRARKKTAPTPVMHADDESQKGKSEKADAARSKSMFLKIHVPVAHGGRTAGRTAIANTCSGERSNRECGNNAGR